MPSLSRGCWRPSWLWCKLRKSTLAAIPRGTGLLQCRNTGATPPWGFWLLPEQAGVPAGACPPVVEMSWSALGFLWGTGWLIFWIKGLAHGGSSLQTSARARGFVLRSKSAKSITLLVWAACGAGKSIITVNSLWMKSGPTKVNSWTTSDFTGTRFYPEPWSAPGSSPMLSAAIHSSSEGKDSREQRRVLLLAQLSLGPAQPAVLRIPLW